MLLPLMGVGRAQRIEATRIWDRAWSDELAGSRRRALVRAVQAISEPTLRDVLKLIGEGLCDLEDTPTAGSVQFGEFVGRSGEGPLLNEFLDWMDLGLTNPLAVAEDLNLPELGQPILDLVDTWIAAITSKAS